MKLLLIVAVLVITTSAFLMKLDSIYSESEPTPCEQQSIKFLEWAYDNSYIKDRFGKWYMDECMAAGWPGDTSHTSKQLFKLFLNQKK